MPKFSVVIPTYNRADGRLQRALRSVATQVYRDFECIVVDDGSTDETEDLCWLSYSTRPFLSIRHEERRGRVVARNTGMAAATGENLCWLDSDDALDPMYLATFAHAIAREPEARLWVCGAVVHGMVKDEKGTALVPKWTKLRKAWMPPMDADDRHTLFDSGDVGTGMFVFHRECYERVGPLPPWEHPDHIADGIDEWLGLPFGTLGYGSGKYERAVDAPPLLRKRGVGHVGNPWGCDHAYFQKLCLHYQVHLIHAALYCQYVR